MEIFIGLWRARPAWHALPRLERIAYMGRLAAAVQKVVTSGGEIVAWGEAGADSAADGYRYYAVWRFADAAGARAYEEQLAAHGWGDYFDYLAVRGPAGSPLDVLTRTINLPAPRAPQ